MNACPFCDGIHHVQRCPGIWAALRAPALFLCEDCGDPIDHDGICHACQEWERHEQLSAARASAALSALERIEIDGVLLPF